MTIEERNKIIKTQDSTYDAGIRKGNLQKKINNTDKLCILYNTILVITIALLIWKVSGWCFFLIIASQKLSYEKDSK